MLCAAMTPGTRALCRKDMRVPHETRVDAESNLSLHGLLQCVVKPSEMESYHRAIALEELLVVCNFPSAATLSGLDREDRITRYKQFRARHEVKLAEYEQHALTRVLIAHLVRALCALLVLPGLAWPSLRF